MKRPLFPPGSLRTVGTIIVLLMIASCRRDALGIPPDSSYVIDKYLVSRIGATSQGGTVFCDFEPLTPMIQSGSGYDVYLWVLCQEYFIHDARLQEGMGLSLPIALTLEWRGSGYVVQEGRIPGEVAQSEELVREYFPRAAWAEIEPQSDQEVEGYNARVERLQTRVEGLAIARFFDPGK